MYKSGLEIQASLERVSRTNMIDCAKELYMGVMRLARELLHFLSCPTGHKNTELLSHRLQHGDAVLNGTVADAQSAVCISPHFVAFGLQH